VWYVSETWGQAAPELQNTATDGEQSKATMDDEIVGTQNGVPNSSSPSAKPAAKESRVISLSDAIGLMEKSGRGEVVKGEKTGDGMDTQFSLVVLNKETKSQYSVNATGTVIIETATPRSTPGKGKKAETPAPKTKSEDTTPKTDARPASDAPKKNGMGEDKAKSNDSTPKTDDKPGSDTLKKKGKSDRPREGGDVAERERRLKKLQDSKGSTLESSKKDAPGSSSTVPESDRPRVEGSSQPSPNPLPKGEKKKRETEDD
jgi:hypothetical protein